MTLDEYLDMQDQLSDIAAVQHGEPVIININQLDGYVREDIVAAIEKITGKKLIGFIRISAVVAND